jgi:adenylyltransferase/sulfurtransferase
MGRLLTYNALEMSFRIFSIKKDPDCPVCGERPSITELIDYEEFCGVPAHDRSSRESDSERFGATPITPEQLRQRILDGKRMCILDVREPHELEISRIREVESINIPARQVLERMNELDTADYIVVLCRFGLQSLKVIRELQKHGFKKVYNLEGGINRWALEIDNSLPLY